MNSSLYNKTLSLQNKIATDKNDLIIRISDIMIDESKFNKEKDRKNYTSRSLKENKYLEEKNKVIFIKNFRRKIQKKKIN